MGVVGSLRVFIIAYLALADGLAAFAFLFQGDGLFRVVAAEALSVLKLVLLAGGILVVAVIFIKFGPWRA